MQNLKQSSLGAMLDVASPTTEYLLVCEARSTHLEDGRWHFVLELADGTPVLEAGDEEPGDLNRLTLLAAVRGLEAIEGAGSVTLVSNNRYLIRSLTDSLPRWRTNDFVWEHFGRRIDIQHADLWRRVDRALTFHRVEACLMTSRLISAGTTHNESIRGLNSTVDSQATIQRSDETLSSETKEWRVDSPHPTLASVHAPSGSSRSDRLRSWLLSGGASTGVTSRRRFTSADLLETT